MVTLPVLPGHLLLLEVIVHLRGSFNVLLEEILPVRTEFQCELKHLLKQTTDQSFVQLLIFGVRVHVFKILEFFLVGKIFLELGR